MSMPIQIVDEDDNPIGQATKQEAWSRGLRHRIVRIMLENEHGEILIQHRSPTKDIFPNCWDNSVAGHVDSGESYMTAALRELKEEIGIGSTQLEELGSYASDETWWGHRFKRFTHVYRLPYNMTPSKLEKGKVDEVRWISVDELRKIVRNHPNEVTDGLRQVVERYYS